MSLSRSGIESTQKRDVEKPSREEDKKSDDVERRENNERRRRTGFHEDLHESRLCVCACVRAFSRERREKMSRIFVIPVVTKTGDFLSVLQKKKKDDDDDGDLPFLLLDDDDHVLRVAVFATQQWYATTTVSSGRERKRRKRKRCVRGKGRAETPCKIETRGRAEQDERHGPDGRDDRDAVLGGTTAIV